MHALLETLSFSMHGPGIQFVFAKCSTVERVSGWLQTLPAEKAVPLSLPRSRFLFLSDSSSSQDIEEVIMSFLSLSQSLLSFLPIWVIYFAHVICLDSLSREEEDILMELPARQITNQ